MLFDSSSEGRRFKSDPGSKPQFRGPFLALLAAQRRRPDPSSGWIIAPAGRAAPASLRWSPSDRSNAPRWPCFVGPLRPTPGDIVEDGRSAAYGPGAHSHASKPGCGCAALPTVPQMSCRRGSDCQVLCESVAEVDLHHCGQVTGPDQGHQHRHRRGLEAGVVPAWRIVAAELGAQLDHQPARTSSSRSQHSRPSAQTARTTCWSILPWTANQASGPTC
jgi:hypothetical protein